METLRTHLLHLNAREQSITGMSKYLLTYSSQSEFANSILYCFKYIGSVAEKLRVDSRALFGNELQVEKQKTQILSFFYVLNHTLLLAPPPQKSILRAKVMDLLPGLVERLGQLAFEEHLVKNMLKTVWLWIQRKCFRKEQLKRVLTRLETLKNANSPFLTFSRFNVDIDSMSDIADIRRRFRDKRAELRETRERLSAPDLEPGQVERLAETRDRLVAELREIRSQKAKLTEAFIDAMEVRLGKSLLEIKDVDCKLDKLEQRFPEEAPDFSI